MAKTKKVIDRIKEFRTLDRAGRALETNKHLSTDAMRRMTETAKESGLSTHLVDEELLPLLTPLVICIGPELAASRHRGVLETSACVPHIEISTYIALRAVAHLDSSTQWRDWSGMQQVLANEKLKTDDEKNDEQERVRLHWLKTMMALVLSLPIGYMHSHTYARAAGKNDSWSPAVKNLDEYTSEPLTLRFYPTNRELAPKQISQRVHSRLYGQPPSIGGLLNAEMDFWSPAPYRDNPFFTSLKASLKESLDHYYATSIQNLPFWWVGLYNHAFFKDPGYAPLTYRVFVDSKISNASEGKSVDDVEPTGKVEPLVQAAAIVPDLPSRLTTLLSWVRSGLQTQDIKVNCRGALFHQHMNKPSIVHTAFYKHCVGHRPELYDSYEELATEMLEHGIVRDEINHFEFRVENKRRGTVNLQPLSEHGIQTLFGSNVLEDNTSLNERIKPSRRASDLVPERNSA